MAAAAHHVALALSVLAVGSAALRVASLAAPSGLERLVAALVIGAATIIAEALALGVVGLGGSTVPVAAAAALTFAGARRVPRPAVRLADELAGWWGTRTTLERFVAGSVAGLSLAWIAWQLANPAIGFDSSLYHYPFVAGWLESGHPGTGLDLSYDIPYGSYPLTDEVAITWGAAISRSWVPLAVWNPLLLGVLVAAVWLALRTLGVRTAGVALAAAALITAPVMVRQLNEPQTDLPALAWLACTAALCVTARRSPALLVPAVVAAGLAVGTKPSTGPMAVAALAVGGWIAREHLRRLAPWLGLGLAAAFVVGGVWYLRNIVEHGSPVWPFAPGPFGDPAPRFLGLVNQTFLDRPGDTIEGRTGEFVERLGGMWLMAVAAVPLLALAVLAPRVTGALRRPLAVSSALALFGIATWTTAWGTGLSTSPELRFAEGFVISSLRYMLPALACAAVAVALATRLRGLAGDLALALLGVVVAWNLYESVQLGEPWTPPLAVLVLGVAAGGALATAASRLPVVERLPIWGPAGMAVVAGLALAPAGPGFLERYTQTKNSTAYGPELIAWFIDQPWFEDGDEAIGIASRGVVAQLAGDRFRHPIELVPQRASCPEVEAIARRMPVVVTTGLFFQGTLGVEGYTAPRCLARFRPVLDADPFFVYRLPTRRSATG